MYPIVLLTNGGTSGKIAASYLVDKFPSICVIVERKKSRARLLWRRVRRLGLVHVCGQLSFMLFHKCQERISRNRIDRIISSNSLSAKWPANAKIIYLRSVNSAECLSCLKECDPKVILVIGTGLIADHVLRSVSGPFINYHAGITPKYRGSYGGYWAKAQFDEKNSGITIHLIDGGIDTGPVLYQARIRTSENDNFSTYPYLQLAAAIPLLERAAHDAINESLLPKKVDLPSSLWSHPTIWYYFLTGILKGVW
jgi:folate-dependent phosphoribosylglycinamide formyltransferase PurN